MQYRYRNSLYFFVDYRLSINPSICHYRFLTMKSTIRCKNIEIESYIGELLSNELHEKTTSQRQREVHTFEIHYTT